MYEFASGARSAQLRRIWGIRRWLKALFRRTRVDQATVYSYRKNAASIGSTTSGSATTQTVPAYSIAVVQLRPT